MKNTQVEVIPLQVGSELRIRNDGEITLDNPELEVAPVRAAADAIFSYRFDPKTGEHVSACWTRWPATSICSCLGPRLELTSVAI